MGIKNWILPEQNHSDIEILSEQTGLDPLICAILSARGFSSKENINQMLNTESKLDDPYLLIDMDKAVERIRLAIDDDEKIAVYGDYDCDGITSTALLTNYLQSVGADVIYYIPSRKTEGYGLNYKALDILHDQKINLIITVDNGVSAHEEIDYATSLGIDVVVTDHHTPRETLPAAMAIVNPHRKDCNSKFKNLAGVGVAFKLICALEEDDGEELLEYYSDMVMLGTIADVVSLTGENRIMVRHGLSRLSDTERPGLLALMAEAGISGENIGGEAVAFGIVPRLNAAGRMGCVDDAVELLLTDDNSYAIELARSISVQNEERKKIESAIMLEIEATIAVNPSIAARKVLVISGENWHHGVVGIVASRIMEKYSKPTLLISKEGNIARGSGRSMEGFSLIDAITKCSSCLTKFGGHKLAAGFSLNSDKINDFAEQLESYARLLYINMPTPEIQIDCVVKPKYLNIKALESISVLEPFGQDNRSPLFLLQKMDIIGIYQTTDKKHIRLRISHGEDSFYAIYFKIKLEDFPYSIGDKIDLVADISVSEYNEKKQISIKIKDLRLSGIQQEDIILQMAWYSGFKDDNLCCDKFQLLPNRDDFANIYKFIKSSKGFSFGNVELYYRLATEQMGFAKMCVALDVLDEMNLIDRSTNRINIKPTTTKADMTKSEILVGLSK